MSNDQYKSGKGYLARRGASLSNGEAHDKDHNLWSRRTFLRQLGIAGSVSMVLGRLPISTLGASPLAMALSGTTNDDRILVLIRLKGGNDGLNTIIPVFNYGTYQAQRPTIAVPNNDIISLSPELGLNRAMQALENRWLDGQMKIVNNVGYPDHNLSHFRSTDLWSSARNADEEADSGWLGRWLDQEFPDFLSNPPADPPAIQIGGAGNLVFTNPDEINMSVQVSNPEELEAIALTGQLYDATAVPACYYGEQLSYLRTVANTTFRYAQVISQAFQSGSNNASYDGSLGAQLALIARLIRGGLRTRLYMVELDGFDTHAGQEDSHPGLLNSLATAVDAFYADLEAGGVANRVLAMTFSEFGRRIEQNSSGGTDHGTAAPLMLFGPGLNGNGFLGGLPDLLNVDPNGNLNFTIDFRSIYATVLEQWLCIDPAQVDNVMGQTFDRLPGLGLDCTTVGTHTPMASFDSQLTAYLRGGELYISYELPTAMPVQLMLFNMLGQPLRQVYSGVQMSGRQEHRLPLADINWAAGVYVCSLRAGGRTVSKPITLGIR